jgi:hypothetical protein
MNSSQLIKPMDDKLDWVGRPTRQRLGLRQPSAALSSPVLRWKSGRGLPQSKTSRNFSGALTKHGYIFIKNDPAA